MLARKPEYDYYVYEPPPGASGTQVAEVASSDLHEKRRGLRGARPPFAGNPNDVRDASAILWFGRNPAQQKVVLEVTKGSPAPYPTAVKYESAQACLAALNKDSEFVGP